ncbi:MAG TPA: DUF1993 domain-containing protein [Steroidobacteraceae bacterium]|jgi:hypothetical protein|nr:DUF1993 domain-containing protein [Steroidobacteraceae bacterium]
MSQSIHDASIPTFVRAMNALVGILDKGKQHAEQEKWDQAAILGTRLYPDMFPLSRQVQVVSDQCKGGIARLAGIEPPKFADTEATFDELKQRLQKTIDFVQGVDAAKLEGADTRAIELKFPQATLNFRNGWEYLQVFVLPNVYFHSSMAYAILRHCGVKVGKADFVGKF